MGTDKPRLLGRGQFHHRPPGVGVAECRKDSPVDAKIRMAVMAAFDSVTKVERDPSEFVGDHGTTQESAPIIRRPRSNSRQKPPSFRQEDRSNAAGETRGRPWLAACPGNGHTRAEGPEPKMRTLPMAGVLLSGLLMAPACSREAPGPSASATPPGPAVKKLQLTCDKPVVSARVEASVDGLAEGRPAELVWRTVTGGWVVEDYYHFRGKKYKDTEQSLGLFRVGSDGHLDAQFTIPEDYGGVHDVMVRIRRQDRGAERHRGHTELRAGAARRPRRHTDRAPRQRPWLADDGEHVGGQLGQQRGGLGLGGELARHGCRAVSRGGIAGRPRREGLHGISGPELSELRAGADGARSAAGVHVSRHLRPSRAARRVRRACTRRNRRQTPSCASIARR